MTGIKTVEQFNVAEAEYQWKWDQANVSKDYIKQLCPNEAADLDGIQVGRATFSKYDDGWRLGPS